MNNAESASASNMFDEATVTDQGEIEESTARLLQEKNSSPGPGSYET
eukprot:CAMPEP_0116873790 /NCGR_PEP_ID=MMETSP0463-20121206/5081_1 /TAXON_ID=181622 /ORGANISM="Strombidinopsis sp, Strain SopsisLIS2011" /LENGTH=46 /DNA_ID= /DNA_START= /DNA_END= /DNA_ORIENTATION=